MSFGEVLKSFRESRRLSQSRLAHAAGMDHSYVSRLESGKRFPTREAIESLARVMKVSEDERDRLLTSAGFAPPIDETSSVLMAVIAERRRQSDRWGVQSHSWPEWMSILAEEVGEASQAANHAHWDGAGLEHLREELVQVAAVAVQIVEAIERIEIVEEAA